MDPSLAKVSPAKWTLKSLGHDLLSLLRVVAKWEAARSGETDENRKIDGQREKRGEGRGGWDGIGVSVYRPFPRESTVGSTEWHYLLHPAHRFAAAMFQTPFFSLSLSLSLSPPLYFAAHVSYVLVSPAISKKFFNINRVRGVEMKFSATPRFPLYASPIIRAWYLWWSSRDLLISFGNEFF